MVATKTGNKSNMAQIVLTHQSWRHTSHTKKKEYGTDSGRAFYARQMVLSAQGIFAGLTVSQLDQKIREKLTQGIRGCEYYLKTKIVQLELDMMYDMLYTKAMVIQTWTGCICSPYGSMCYWCNNVIITNMGTFKNKDMSQLAPQERYWSRGQRLAVPISLGQFSLATSVLRDRSTPRLILKAMNAFGLGKLYRNTRDIKYIEACKMVGHFTNSFGIASNMIFIGSSESLGHVLDTGMLAQHFEVSIIIMHLLTAGFTSWAYFLAHDMSMTQEVRQTILAVTRECEKLSNDMMYLLLIHPSVLPVSSDYTVTGLSNHLCSTRDLTKSVPELDAITDKTFVERMKLLDSALDQLQLIIPRANVPVSTSRRLLRVKWFYSTLSQVLHELKGLWIRLIVYAASKSCGELHARRLGDGGEFLTFIWLLLAHHGLGNVAEVGLRLLLFAGILSRYDYKSKMGNGSFRETDSLTFICVPFILVHLGGQDTITAFSIEDNNLWLRHLLNLVVQYAERTWALKHGSLEGLQSSVKSYKDKEQEGQKDNKFESYSSRISYARRMVQYARGLFAGLTVSQLERIVRKSLTQGLRGCDYTLKMKIVILELGMMYDTLYRWFSRHGLAQHGHRTVDVVITYTATHCLPVPSLRKPVLSVREEKTTVLISVGQFSLATSALHDRSTPRLKLKVKNAFGLEKLYRDLWHVKQVEGHELVEHFVEWFNTSYLSNIRTMDVRFNLLDILSQRFEMFVKPWILFYLAMEIGEPTIKKLPEECEKLSNYMMYLLVVHPSMLPVSSDYAAMELFDRMKQTDIRSRTDLPKMFMKQEDSIRLTLLESTLDELRMQIPEINGSVKSAMDLLRGFRSRDQLLPMFDKLRKVWILLLVYAASKSRGELHAMERSSSPSSGYSWHITASVMWLR
uniref:DUF4220 domain-containing protein n=1 Tax=Leersia perrieri TaxID=77586 RepID=A0A0D9WE72_9ORYZ